VIAALSFAQSKQSRSTWKWTEHLAKSQRRPGVRGGAATGATAGSRLAVTPPSVSSMDSRNPGTGNSSVPPILICYDGSELARRAIRVAAKLLAPRAAVVLDVGPVLTVSESIVEVSVLQNNALVELNKADALDRAREGALIASEAGFAATALAEVAKRTWEGIVEVADRLDSPLIVIGTRGLSCGRELFSGSVAHDVVRHAARPVLVVPPQHETARKTRRRPRHE
jgi:nucleotide-binding universal stress UspA family protein